MALTTAALLPAMTLDEHDLARLRKVAIVGLVVLNLFDILLTQRLLAQGGIEANPVMAPFVHGTTGIAVKVGLPVLLGFRHLRAPLRRPLVLGLCWVCVIYLGVVLWNSHLLSQVQVGFGL
jgi:hypothetical protein